MLLKEVLMSHSEYRGHSGTQDLSWQARLHKSGIQIVSLVEASFIAIMLFSVHFGRRTIGFPIDFFSDCMQALVYDKMYDNFIRSACRQGGSAEAVLESETVAQEFKKIADALANEEAERKVAAGIVESSEPEDAEMADTAEFLNMSHEKGAHVLYSRIQRLLACSGQPSDSDLLHHPGGAEVIGCGGVGGAAVHRQRHQRRGG